MVSVCDNACMYVCVKEGDKDRQGEREIQENIGKTVWVATVHCIQHFASLLANLIILG